MTDVFFLLQPGILMLDLAGPAEAFRIAGKHGAGIYRLHFIGAGKKVSTSLGMEIANVHPLPKELPEDALVVIMGTVGHGFDIDNPGTAALCEWLRRIFDGSRHKLACVCAGALLAGAAGLLDGRRCTTHHDLTDKLATLAPKARVEENKIFVIDGSIMTSAGITAGIDLALHIISEISGDRVAMDVARDMVVYLRRSGGEKQQSSWLAHRNHSHAAIHRVQNLIAHDPARDWPLSSLAEAAHLSIRHLTRLFRLETGTNIVTYTQSLRVALAKRKLDAGSSVEEAAFEAGFDSTRSLRRIWPRFESGTPGQARTRAGKRVA